MEADGRREPDTDQAEAELGDIVADETDEEEDEHQEALEVECSLEVGLDVMPLGPRILETGYKAERLTRVVLDPGVPYEVKLPTRRPNMTFMRGVVCRWN